MKEKIALLAVFANLVLAVGKILVGYLASSASVFAEGVHSGMDVLSSAISLVGIRIAKKPVDKKHPYGHYKFEVLSGLIITAILFATGLWIIYKAYLGFSSPSKLKIGYLALGVMALSAIINEVMSRLKIHYGKKENSISLISDGVHSRLDVYTSIAIFAGLVLAKYWVYADTFLAFLIGVYIIKESVELGKEATDSLLDVSAGEEIEQQIRSIARGLNIEVSDLKTQKKGSAVTANIEIGLPKDLTVDEAAKASSNLKEELLNKIEPLKYVAVQLRGSDVTASYYKPKETLFKFGLGRGFGWQGKGPEGYCVCPKCGYKQKHTRGVPCSTVKCPNCGAILVRN